LVERANASSFFFNFFRRKILGFFKAEQSLGLKEIFIMRLHPDLEVFEVFSGFLFLSELFYGT